MFFTGFDLFLQLELYGPFAVYYTLFYVTHSGINYEFTSSSKTLTFSLVASIPTCETNIKLKFPLPVLRSSFPHLGYFSFSRGEVFLRV